MDSLSPMGVTCLVMQLIRNADVYAPEHLGTRHLLLGGGRVLWIGSEPPRLPSALEVKDVDLEGRGVGA